MEVTQVILCSLFFGLIDRTCWLLPCGLWFGGIKRTFVKASAVAREVQPGKRTTWIDA